MNKKLCFTSALLSLFLLSCGSNATFRQDKELSGGWELDSPVRFVIEDSITAPSNTFVHIRNNSEYPFANLFLIITLLENDQIIERDTLEYAMADARGNWLGSGFNELKESKLLWKSAWIPKGELPYTIEIQQANRENGKEFAQAILPGILTVGFSVEPQQIEK